MIGNCMMTTAVDLLVPSFAKGHLRRLDVLRDLEAVADLVETCFADTLDPDGRRYLQQMRDTAKRSHLLRWTSTINEYSAMPMTGYVWENEGRIIGNLSLIPFSSRGQRCYLIANVAVNPAHRDRGIARALTIAALEHARNHRIDAAWLQVRQDNPAAIHIYKSLGFRERERRTSWRSFGNANDLEMPAGYAVRSRRISDWRMQRRWLNEIYPPEYSWHLSLDRTALRPDLWGMLYRFFSFKYPHHWVVQRDGSLQAVLTYLQSGTYGENLWLAVHPEANGKAIRALLVQSRKEINRRGPLTLNYPAGWEEEEIKAAGFYEQQTLIWMSFRFN